MKELKYKIYISSPDSILVSFELNNSNKQTIGIIKNIKNEIKQKFNKQLLYTTTAFDTILLKFKPKAYNILDLKDQIEKFLRNYNLDKQVDNKFKTYEIPICYEPFGKDLESLASHSGLKIEDIIKLHSDKIYTINVIGFLPGFLYMGSVDKSIEIPRLKKPRPSVEKGSVGIAEDQTGIYPNASPGGWQIIGRTPVNIFNVDEDPPSRFRPGDQIKFKPINRKSFDHLFSQTNIQLKI